MTTLHKLGIIGGTFNPIHIGHLIIAESVREAYELDHVLFIPARIPPHKKAERASALHRLEMTRLAVMTNPNFSVSDMEMKRTGPSYSIDTIRELRKLHGDSVELYFIAGTDTIQDLPNWRKVEEVLTLCNFIGATRPDGTEIIDNIVEQFGELGKKIHQLRVPEVEISSTDLRNRLHSGKSVRYMIPQTVIEYIRQNGVYSCIK